MNNKKLIILITFSCLLGLSGISYAVPAAPDIFEVSQPDGHVFNAIRRGDEWNNRVEKADGYTVKKGNDDFWYYILRYDRDLPVFSNRRAHRPPQAGMKKHVTPDEEFMKVPPGISRKDQSQSASSDYGTMGSEFSVELQAAPEGSSNGAILFILAEFTDRAGTYTEASFGTFISNNINDYFDKASYGVVAMSAAIETSGVADNGVIGWVDLEYEHPDTGSSTNNANRQLTKDAILAADPFIDFSAYDNNSDGYVDADELAVVVVVAGYEEAYNNPPSPSIWAHRATLGAVGPPTVDTVIVGDYHGGSGGYAQFGEIHRVGASSSHQATMGIMVHELGHLIFGLPDLYDTNTSNGDSEGIGGFGLMGGGSWGRADSDSYSGETPVLPCAWSKYYLWWVDGTESSGSTSITAAGSASADSSNTTFKLLTDSSGEFFLVENRQPLGYDQGLERWLGTGFGGLAIWHIDENKTDNTEQCSPPDDCSSFHYMVALEQADNNWDLENNVNRGNTTDLWYSGNAISFNDISSPDSKLYDGASSSASVTEVSVSGTVMTAALSAATTTLYSENFESGLPAGWSIIDNAGGGAVWRFDDPANRGNNTGGFGSFAIIDSDYAGFEDIDTELVTSVIDTTNFGSVFLEFKTDFLFYSGGSDEVADVDISQNGTPGSWINVWRKTASYRGPKTETLDITAYAADSSVTVRFRYYNANYDWWWQVDNVVIKGTQCGSTYYEDSDDDGYGNPNISTQACPRPSGYVANNSDCDDNDNLEFPNQIWYEDVDGDLYSSGNVVVQCLRPAGHKISAELTAISGDCDDSNENIYPGAAKVTGGAAGFYPSLQNAYASAGEGDTIQNMEETIIGALNFNMDKTVTLQGGYNCGFISVSGLTTISGNLTVSNGALAIGDFILQ